MTKTAILVPNRTGFCLQGLIVSLLLLLVGACGGTVQADTTPKPVTIEDLRQDSAPVNLVEQPAAAPAAYADDTAYLTAEDFELSGESGVKADLPQRGNVSPIVGLEEDDCWTKDGKLYCRVIKQPCKYDASKYTEQEACWLVFPVGKE